MNTINEKLKKLYDSKLENLKKLFSETKDEEHSFPLLMHCWDNQYLASKYKILFVGQETYGWDRKGISDDNPIEGIIKIYEEFKLAKEYVHKNKPFWGSIYHVNEKLNGSNVELNFLWTNVLKMGNKGKGRPSDYIVTALHQHYNILEDEFKIIKPDVVIFFSGPDYDKDINRQLKDVVYEPFSEKYPESVVAKLSHHYLPTHAFRTYHPGFLQRKRNHGLGDVVNEIIKQITSS